MNKARVTGKPDCSVWLSVCARRARMWLGCLGILWSALTSPAAPQTNAKTVLVLSGGRGRISINQMESVVRSHIPWAVNFSVVDLENPRFEDAAYQQSLAETLKYAYGREKLDLVIAVMDPSLRFATRFRDEAFLSAPIVFMSVGSSLNEQKIPGTTGVGCAFRPQDTIDLALRLHPDAKTVAVISNESEAEKDFLSGTRTQLLRYQSRVREIDLVGPASGQMLEKVAALPPDTVVFFQFLPHDADQPALGVFDLLSAAARRLPTYSVFPDLVIGRRGIGGATCDSTNDAVVAGEMAARVLKGERPDDIPVVRIPNVVRVDWPELRRWHIPESALPAGAVIVNRPPTIWDQYRNYILIAIAVIVAQALLIAGLLWQRARKRKAEAILRESEQRFRVMADATPSLIWMCDTKGKMIYLNEQRLAFTGPDPNVGYGDTWITFIHPDDVKGVLDALWQALKDQRPFSKEYRLHRNDGAYRWMFDVASPRVNGDGSFGGFIGSAIDVTDQKIAQQALEQVSGQLIEAQEKERTRIARDLHDDICQRLALLSMELEQAKHVPAGSSSNADDLEAIRRHCSEIAGDVQSLSHELHSTKLDYLGVAAAARGFCREFSKQYGVAVDFTEKNVPPRLPKDISLCLFRVTQEALHNALKHSGADKFTVDLSAIPGEVRLQVTDAGKGFNIEAAKKNRGLGLVSMQERVHLVHGRFSIESKPGNGTKILVFVPLIAENEQASENRNLEDTASMQRTS